eukprot:SAG31_NODE_1529_length_8001_cov_13.491268_6_plen_89_part_00
MGRFNGTVQQYDTWYRRPAKRYTGLLKLHEVKYGCTVYAIVWAHPRPLLRMRARDLTGEALQPNWYPSAAVAQMLMPSMNNIALHELV